MKRLYPDQPVVGIGAVIIHEGKIAINKERQRAKLEENGLFPAAWLSLEKAQSKQLSAKAKKKQALDVEKPTLIDVVSNVDYDEQGKIKYHYVIIDYFVHVKNGTAEASSDAVELQWVPFDDVEDYDLTASFRFFFSHNRETLEKSNSD